MNFDIDISNQLFALYNFVKKNLMNARITRTDRGLKDAVKVLGDMTFKEIAEALDMPMGTVTWNYQDAIKQLRRFGYE